MSSHYANVEWAVDQRGMELPRLRAETEDALRQAKDDAEARRILERFVDAFGDGHLEAGGAREARCSSTGGPSDEARMPVDGFLRAVGVPLIAQVATALGITARPAGGRCHVGRYRADRQSQP